MIRRNSCCTDGSQPSLRLQAVAIDCAVIYTPLRFLSPPALFSSSITYFQHYAFAFSRRRRQLSPMIIFDSRMRQTFIFAAGVFFRRRYFLRFS
jgi:hypothetical protein